MRALIVEDGASRGALTATRALARSGWFVGIASPSRADLAASSRLKGAWHRIVPAASDPDRFVAAVASAVSQWGYEVVFGAGDAEVLALSRAREQLSAIVPHAPHEAVLRSFDKLELTEAARAAGLAVPHTVTDGSDELKESTLPAIVKARLHWSEARSESARIEAEVCREGGSLERAVARVRALGGQPLVQELLVGHLLALVVVLDPDGDLLAVVQQGAEATFPADAGVSVRASTMRVDEELLRRSLAMLASLGWTGLAELQFVAPTDDIPRLVDLNGRFYGSLALALAAGVNLPSIWASSALGLGAARAPAARIGVRYQWLEGDLRRVLAQRSGSTVGGVIGCLRYTRGAAQSIWDPRDPRPAVRHALVLVRRLVAKLFRGLWSGRSAPDAEHLQR